MDIIDKCFKELDYKKKIFIILIGLAYFLVALIAYIKGLTSIFESFLIFAVGALYSDVLRLNYRIEYIENKNIKKSQKKK
jgi:hypothetical protein